MNEINIFVYVYLAILTIILNVVKNIFFEIFVKNIKHCKIPKKYLICAWKLSLNKSNYAIQIDGVRQQDRKTNRQTKSLIEELCS